MDEFAIERPELNGALMTLEFGPGGRIQQLWASDPTLPEEGDEFQFVLPPITLGEEFADDYYPGTILLGARIGADDPWIVSRNTDAEVLDAEDPRLVQFEYEFGLLPELRVTGKFYEIPGPIPQIAWDIRVANRGRFNVEIGELAFPFALNNLYEGLGRPDKNGGKTLWSDRLVIHKYLGGSASYLFAQRLAADPPGLLIFPGPDTSWEFFTHVPASLNSPMVWEGIPVVYVYSKAAQEREGWDDWMNGHSSLILEPGDSRVFQIRFVPADRDRFDGVSQTLALCGHPAMKLLPAAVSPADVGVAVEISGSTPTQFYTNRDASLETDSDEEGGFCFIKPAEPGPVRLSFEDTLGRLSHVHLLFTEPIETLIRQRADWIVKNQVHDEPGSALHKAILVADPRTGQRLVSATEFTAPFVVEGGLSDALFLAEKNAIYPEPDQVRVLDEFIDEFLRDDLQNPGDDTVGSSFADMNSVALNYGRPHVYPLVFNLYHAMYRVASITPARLAAKQYLEYAYRTALAMVRHGIPRQGRNTGYPGYSRVFELLRDLNAEGMHDEVDRLMPFVSVRAEDLLRKQFPYGEENVLDTSVFEEAFTAARYLNDEAHQERAMRCAYAARSLSPNWWWYGSDSRQWDDFEHGPLPFPFDRGELCLGHTGPENSMMFFETLDRDYALLSEAYMRLAFGGMLGVWALVNPDGSASMAYGPDFASKLRGHLPTTGDIGLALFHYLRAAGAYVMPNRNYGVFTFGCHFELNDDHYVVRPWDGVGRRVVLRQMSAEFHLSVGKIREVRLDTRKRWCTLVLENVTDLDLRGELRVRGLWGQVFEVLGERVEASDGELAVSLPLGSRSVARVEIRVKG